MQKYLVSSKLTMI